MTVSLDSVAWSGPAGNLTFLSGRFFGTMVLMATQETLQPKKRRGPKPTGQGVPIQVRLQPDSLLPLDAWIAAQPDPKPSRPEAIRHALTDWLTGQGYVRHREDPEGVN
ncbi:hypothetical protein MKK75_17980 [Methylobacterium sp. J-030]|uniref:hypothetical protein n=1 Tax=Methylobacterium sp. J-030 TaxID=2836627 RepID=UPI001FBB74AF|nr:hypothetical protein [Methylobacterium sp. J-030]MCJ2070657.1 hypothetical protein [Methylobacterium sp. J-030]